MPQRKPLYGLDTMKTPLFFCSFDRNSEITYKNYAALRMMKIPLRGA
ncbi:MAG: hypothetical protein WCQ72_07050 [Eubacteriales bacterium]